MNIFSIILIAIGLAMDAFAVSITRGITIKRTKLKRAFMIAMSFGLFQAIMPVAGWLCGTTLQDFISGFDHWIAFSLLSIIGFKMIYGSFKSESLKERNEPLSICVLLMLSLATSIDALAIGLTLSFLNISIALPAIVIGTITFFLSFIGVYIGSTLGHFFERKIEILGGIVLIGIGIKILIEHL